MIDIQPDGVAAVVLGIMQDGGLPHIGCRCVRCSRAYHDAIYADYVACLGIVDRRRGRDRVWLVDATPNIKFQLEMLGDYLGPNPRQSGRLRQPDGVFLTHAHMGHIAGLTQFSKPAMVVQHLQLFASPRLIALLKQNTLLSQTSGFDFINLEDQRPLDLSHDVQIIPITVPHRDEHKCGTFAFKIDGPKKSLLYLPDIDRWGAWNEADEVLAGVDYALVDGTFNSVGELGGRQPVAHPLVPHTIELFSNLNTKLFFTHMNHTNPLLDTDSPEKEMVLAAGVGIAHTRQVFYL